MTTQSLERITTKYIDVEDRIQLSGQTGSSAPVVIWLTQRLLQRLIPVVLKDLERQRQGLLAEVLQGFAQQAARAGTVPQAPVQFNDRSPAWLAHEVDVTQSKTTLQLVFHGVEGQTAVLALAVDPLRQWLNILYDACLKAEWPHDVWPAWIRESVLPVSPQPMLLH